MIMKYRWGFLDDNDAFSECFPKVDDGTAIDFAPESGEVFYRAKLNGNLSFRYEFDAILAEGYNYEHKIILQWYDADNDEWKEVWKGRFALTDCEIDYDTKTITVTPSTLDRYTLILDHREDEYNLVKLAAQQQPVGIQIRPLMQFYSLNDSKLVNLIGGNTWEASCDTTGASTIETDYHFRMIKENLAFWLKFDNTVPNGDLIDNTILMSGTPDYSGSPREFDMTGQYWNGSFYSTLTLRCRIVLYDDETHFALYWPSGGGWEVNPFVVAVFERDEAGTAPAITIHSYLADANAQWDKVYFRMLLNAEGDTYHGQPLFDLSANDMAGTNLNYNKISQIAPVGITFYQNTQTTPSEWGLSYNNEYFLKPSGQYFPIGQGLWKYVSVWGLTLVPYTVFDDAIKLVQIRDCYKLPSVITRLFQKAGLTPQYFISRVLNGGNAYVGEPFYMCITPRSNVISSYYDTPAQNAPITLAKILSMLKQAYQIYWHIDENGNIHFEHISYYDNGYKYTEDAPGLLVDLETELHTNTKNNKVFGQNKVKFDKQDMPQQIKFLWEDKQTPPFDGYAIKMLDKYVNQGNTEEKAIGGFDSDVDFVLASPNDVSKDGMFLFACPASGGVISWNLDIQDFTIKDETGFEYEVSIQNADAAFWKIHDSFWRYSLPCENVNINNEDTTAKTTGRFKLQSVEFADTIMAEILKDVDNCNKVLRTQQGDGHIKTLSINLNSLVAKGDLLFNFVGRWYYLKGLALGNSFNAIINGESITIEVSANKYSYRYKEPIATLKFAAADVVSVEFGDCDNLENLTSCDEMFDGCEELLAVDFGDKTFGAVTSANNMFRGCVALTTLICPDSSTWKADLDFSDCPDLTLESFYDLIKFLYYYNAGVHTITPNTTFWNALDADTQNDLLTKASARGWTIGIPAQYSITGQSAANTVYATINGSSVEIPVSGGLWQYDYNAPITSISFENDADVTDIDFSLSDGLAGVTSLNDAFKCCVGLTTVDFSNCDLSNLASATDAFAGCTALYELIIPSGTWQPDIDLSSAVMPKSEMLNVINGLYTYTSGTHTITFNQTIWDAMSVADQQAVFDAADAKGWTTNAVAVVFKIKGTSTAASETLVVSFIDNDTQVVTQETIVCAVSGGAFEHQYTDDKSIYSIDSMVQNSTTITSIDFSESDGLTELTSATSAFGGCTALSAINVGTFSWLVDIVLSDCPIASASMLAFLGNFADYSLGNQHLVRISPYSAADMGANADVIKTTLTNKNWRLPLSQIGKYTRAELKTMMENGYVPVSTYTEFSNVCGGSNTTMGEDSEFYGNYQCDSSSNYVVVTDIIFSWNIYGSRVLTGIFDGNLLDFNPTYRRVVLFSQNDGIVRNMYYHSVNYVSNGYCAFITTNNGTIEDGAIDINCPFGATYQSVLCKVNYGTIRRVQIRTLPISGAQSQRLILNSNQGLVQDVCVIGVFDFVHAFIFSNGASATIERCIVNSYPANPNYNNNQHYGVAESTSGTITNSYQNSERFTSLGAGTNKTSAQLKQDAIGSGIYADYSSDVWEKDNDGYPTLKIARNFKWTTDFSNISNYIKLMATALSLPTSSSSIELTISSSVWNNASNEEKYELKTYLASKNYTISNIAPAYSPAYTISGHTSKADNCVVLRVIFTDDNTQATSGGVTYVPTDSNGDFSLGYSGKKVSSFENFAQLNRNSLISIIMNEAMTICTTLKSMFDTTSTNLQSVDMSNATMENVINTAATFYNCTNLTTIIVPNLSKAVLPTSSPTDASIGLRHSPLTYASMLNVANWLSDLTGQSAHTCTFKTSAWNALSTAEQNTIDGILSGKNWNRAIA